MSTMRTKRETSALKYPFIHRNCVFRMVSTLSLTPWAHHLLLLPLWPSASHCILQVDLQHQNVNAHIILFPELVPRYLSYCPFSAKNNSVYVPPRPSASRPLDIRRGREQSESPHPSPSASSLHSFYKSHFSIFDIRYIISCYLIDWIMGRNLVSGPGCDFWGVSSVTYPMMPIFKRLSSWASFLVV